MARRPFCVDVRHRSLSVLAAFALTALSPQAASAQFGGPFCDSGTTENCIVSLTVNGAPPTSNITASVMADSVSSVYTINVFNTNNPSDPFELASAVNGLTTASVVSLTFRMSSSATDPRVAVSTGLISDWAVNTAPNPNEVTITASPRASSWARGTTPPDDEPPGGCTPDFCENTADVDYQALLLAAFDPMPAPPGAPAATVTFLNEYATGYYSTNAQYFSPIPSYTPSTAAISFLVGAPHFKFQGGSVVNIGFVRMFIPEGVITDPTLWNIAGGSAALAANNSLTTVTVGGSAADFAIEALTSGGVALGALVKVGETSPFSYSVPEVVIKPSASAPFTDDPLVAGSIVVRVVHIAELRSRIDQIRVARGLSAYTWTDSTLASGSTIIRAAHITDLRTALNEAYSAAKRSLPSYTDATLSGAPIKAVHISELRAAVIAIE